VTDDSFKPTVVKDQPTFPYLQPPKSGYEVETLHLIDTV
jgi:hypothetical protein